MKKIILLGIGLFVLPILLNAEAIPANSKITSVTVYSDRAMVARTATIDLEQGINEIKFEKLPAVMLDESIRATGTGAKANITEMRVNKIFLARADEMRIKSLEDEIRKLDDRNNAISDKAGVLGSKKKLLESFQNYSSEKIEKEMALAKMDLDTWKNSIEYMASSLNDANENLRLLNAEQKQLQEKLTAMRKELNEIRSLNPLEGRTAVITVNSQEKGKYTLQISYVVMGARWTPVYDARAFTASREVEVTYMADISQKTGEDWADADLTLSTAKPAAGAKAPDLSTWYVNIVEPMLQLESLEKETRMVYKSVTADKTQEVKDEMKYAVPQATGTSMEFKIVKKETIPGDGSSNKVTITVENLKPLFEYVTVPKVAALAFMRSNVVNSTKYTFLPGPVNVFQDMDYVGKSYLSQIVPNDTFTLDLGASERIKSKKEFINKKKEILLFGKERLTYT